MTAEGVRFVLVKPGDVLIIGNLGNLTNLNPDVIERFAEAVGVAVTAFSADITLGVAPPEALAAPEPLGTPIDHTNRGHGHVIPRADGVKARCGGPPLCRTCGTEQARVMASGQQMVASAVKPPRTTADPDRCDPPAGHHSTPHRGCILR